MPVGLDGNPDPVRSRERDVLLDSISERVLLRDQPRLLVGIDGRAGSGKSTLADELAQKLRERGRSVIRATTDSFHRPRAQRLRRGATSAEGYIHDSHQIDRIRVALLEPFSRGTTSVLTAAFDEPSDTPAERVEEVPTEAILVFDGLFVHRPELATYWTTSVLLVADRRCDQAWIDFLLADLPEDATARSVEIGRRLARARWPRYRDGWRLYLEHARPAAHATFVVDNNDFAAPHIVPNPT